MSVPGGGSVVGPGHPSGTLGRGSRKAARLSVRR